MQTTQGYKKVIRKLYEVETETLHNIAEHSRM